MNNLEYICEKQRDVVGSLLEDLASSEPSHNVEETIILADFPVGIFDDIERMESWLDSERIPGAWQANDCRSAVQDDMTLLSNTMSATNYLAKRGIGYDVNNVDEAGAFAALDIAFRWQRLYLSATNGDIFEANYRARKRKELEHDDD